MSDSSESAFSFLSNWKFGLAVCVPCFAVGLGVTYYYYSKTPNKSGRIDVPSKSKSAVVDINDDDQVVKKLLEPNGIDQNAIKDHPKVA